MYLIALFFIYLFEINYSFKRTCSIFAPSVLFTSGFLACTVGALMYWKEWDMQTLGGNTFLVLSLGVILFNHSSIYFTRKINYNFSKKKVQISTPSLCLLTIWLCAQVVFYYLYGMALMRTTQSDNFALAAATVADSKIDDTISISIPRYLIYSFIVVEALTFFLYYFFANEIFDTNKKKWKIIILSASVLVSFVGPLVGGSRGSAIIKIFSFVTIIYICYVIKCHGFKNAIIPKRIKLFALTFICLMLTGWATFGAILGRESTSDANYVMAVYCGAELKNLDMYINTNKLGTSNNFGHETFIGVYSYLNKQMNDRRKTREFLDLPFNSYHGYTLGNVYTCFYMFLYDFGYIGVPLIILLMSLICSFVWKRVVSGKESSIVYTFIYSVICFDLLFSFFSNKLFESLVNIGFLRQIIIWILLIKVLKCFNYIKISNIDDVV